MYHSQLDLEFQNIRGGSKSDNVALHATTATKKSLIINCLEKIKMKSSIPQQNTTNG